MISKVLHGEIERVVRGLWPDRSGILFSVTPEKRFGDYTTNVALAVGGSGINPRDVAAEIIEELNDSKDFSSLVKKAEIAGPGFINFHLSDEAIIEELKKLNGKIGNNYDFLSGKKINVEFISANPTGELHIGHGRGAFYGDALSNILSFAGGNVFREYYVNDSRESNQIKELGKTALGQGEQYKTEKLAAQIKKLKIDSDSPSDVGFQLAEAVQNGNRDFIENKLNINFDNWYSEDEKLFDSGLNKKIFEELKNKGFTYEKDGAVWLRTSEYGDDEDRVLVRSDGTFTYFMSDIAYHADKFSNGYDEVVNVWGADHHGHVKRMQAVKNMLGWRRDLKIFITQLVSLKEGGVTAKMSKRAGNVILLEELVDEFGIDVVRWFFSEKSLNTHMEFDMALAKEHSAKNPVFYVQYAHARICSILNKAKEVKSDGSIVADILKEKTARALAVKVAEFPETVSLIAEDCQVHRLTIYVYELASEFAKFYENVRIMGEGEYNAGALALASTTKDTIAKSLALLGISAPEKM